jgi:hypothetical protein
MMHRAVSARLFIIRSSLPVRIAGLVGFATLQSHMGQPGPEDPAQRVAAPHRKESRSWE